MFPVFRSCRLSPPIAAAQQTTAPINIAAAAPFEESISKKLIIRSELNKIVAIVTPEIGLLDYPTTPAIYAATAENRKPKISITNDKITAELQEPIIPKYVKEIGTSIAKIAIKT